MQQIILSTSNTLDIEKCVLLILKYYTDCREHKPSRPYSFIRGFTKLLDPYAESVYTQGTFTHSGMYSARLALFR